MTDQFTSGPRWPALYVTLSPLSTARTVALSDTVNVDYDAHGVPTGVEILLAAAGAAQPEETPDGDD